MIKKSEDIVSSTRILVIVDNYLIGGRESYLETYLTALKGKISLEVLLLANRVDSVVSDSVFDNVFALKSEKVKKKISLESVLIVGRDIIDQYSPDIIWVHHYQLLPAFLLAYKYKLPLLTTMHGTLLSQGRLKSKENQLGLACVLQHSGFISSVSEEINCELLALANPCNLKTEIIANAVRIKKTEYRQPNFKPFDGVEKSSQLRVVLLSRHQKIDHIRASIVFFCSLCEIFPNAIFKIYCGANIVGKGISRYTQILNVLGRKWALRNVKVFKVLNRIHLEPMTNNVHAVIESSDVVMGMGRVALEAIGMNKPTILVGYRQVVDLIDDTNFLEFQHANFSGRGIKAKKKRDIINKLLNSSIVSQIEYKESIDIDIQLNRLRNTIVLLRSNNLCTLEGLSKEIDGEINALFNDEILSDRSINDSLPYLSASVSNSLNKLEDIDLMTE